MDEKMMKVLGAVIAGFVVFIVLLFVISSCSKQTYTFEKLEEKMMAVTQKYYEDNKDELPALDKDSKTYTLKKMISDGYIDELSKLFDDDNIKCDGSITVTNNNGYYVYSPYLSCGDDYETKYLKDKIVEDNLVESGVGLYEVKDQFIFKGETNKNYVQFNEKLFRIMRINDDGSIRLFEETGVTSQVWDNRYNPDTKFDSGINEYYYNSINSRIKDNVEAKYKEWPEELKGYILTQDLCIGKRSQADVTKDGSTECSQKLPNQTFGLLAAYEYLQASLDTNCQNTLSVTCRNYNWFANLKSSYWTVTADAESSRFSYLLYQTLLMNNASSFSSMNVVFNLSDKAVYVSGTGTFEDPYIFH